MILPAVLLLASSHALLLHAASAVVTSKELIQPPIFDADILLANEGDTITLDLNWTTIDPGFEGSAFEVRSLGGSVPGPTIKISAGNTLRLKFRNRLEEQEEISGRKSNGVLNQFRDPDTANLHFHGGYVSSVSPADDSETVVLPGSTFDYVVNFPADHSPGLHWIHPHHHGAGAMHISSGAVLALVVKDSPGSLPPQVEEAEERLVIFQDWAVPDMIHMAGIAGDTRGKRNLELIEGGEDVGQRFVTINGVHLPTVTLTRGVWERWRILYAGWRDLPLKFMPIGDDNKDSDGNDNCEFHLLAKDGIYIQDYPRVITKGFPIPPAGRADVMVRCHRTTSDEGISFKAMDRKVMTLQVREASTSASESSMDTQSTTSENTADAEANSSTSTTDADAVTDQVAIAPKVTHVATTAPETQPDLQVQPLEPWTPANTPLYLESVLTTVATPGCSCETKMTGYDDTGTINDNVWIPGNRFMHTSHLGAIVQRNLRGMHEHSYHQHIYPFQLVGGSGVEDTEYFRKGDWHDVFMDDSQQGPFEVRYRTTKFAGKMMVHCHNVQHADRGMMAKEYVRAVEDGGCTCNTFEAVVGAGIVDEDLNAGAIEELGGSSSSNSGMKRKGLGIIFVLIPVSIATLLFFVQK